MEQRESRAGSGGWMAVLRLTLMVVLIALPAALFAQAGPIVGNARLSGTASPNSVGLNANLELSIDVDLTNVSGGADGSTAAALGAYGIRILFVRTDFQFIGVSGGTSPAFSAPPYQSTNPATANANGTIDIVSTASGTPPSGKVNVAKLTFKALATGTSAFSVGIANGIVSADFGAGTALIPAIASSERVTVVPVVPSVGAPTDLRPRNGATDVSRTPQLTWDAGENATSYRVYFGTTSNPPVVLTTPHTSFTPGTLKEGQQYHWRVESVNDTATASSEILSFTTAEAQEPPPPPCEDVATPSGIAAPAQAPSGNTYDFSWSAVSGATHYVVEESTSSTFDPAVTNTIPAPAVKATFTHSVEQTTTYYYRVRAVRTGGDCPDESPFSGVATTQVFVTEAPQVALRGIVPVVGSGAGNFGSFFRTSLQLYNPGSNILLGKIIYHPMGSVASESDPWLEYAILPGQTVTYSDIVVAMGQAGLGSLEFIGEDEFPMVAIRVFNDSGAQGTVGFFEDLLGPEQALQADESTVLIAPTDASKSRMNFGVRTLAEGATLQITLKTRDGLVVKTLTRSYPPEYFVQVNDRQFLEHLTGLFDSDVVVVKVMAGSAFVYGALTDNTTNDPALQLGKPVKKRVSPTP